MARDRLDRVLVAAASVGVVLGGVIVSASGATTSGPATWRDQHYARGPADNPLKGFVPFRGASSKFPYSMEWSYIPWKDIQRDQNTFNWTPIDEFLEDAASRGHQGIFRLYADYPDEPYAVPDFLVAVSKRSYSDHGNGVHATSYSPDYDDDRLVRAMVGTIEAMGRRYDGDPRIGFVTVGFIGFFGEWHTYRDTTCACDTWMPSAKTQTVVLDAFDRAFDRTKLLVRYPDVGWKHQAMGFHDDAFANQTIAPPKWKFTGRLKKARATKQWQTQPIGGELFPPDQPCAFSLIPCNAQEGFDPSVDATHASWIINHYAFSNGYALADYARAVAAAQRLGYDLFVSAVRISNATTTSALAIDIKIQNRGVAPFYYKWPMQLGVASSTGEIEATYDTTWDIRSVIKSRKDITFSHKQSNHGLNPGRHMLLLRVVNPLSNGKPLVFANEKWGETVTNWLTLDEFNVGSDAPLR